MVFSGTLGQFFPAAEGGSVPLRAPGPSAAGLEGEFRPGHFAGVATICARLFEVVRPTRAYFGAKDFQQCQVVRELAGELGYPNIVVCPTSRDADGLARSSRNQLLTAEDRREALGLSRALFAARAAWRAGERLAQALEARLGAELARGRLAVEYAVVRDPRALAVAPNGPLREARALIAARAGGVRLIDNLDLSGEAP
jgi:pantoate--beta-alanine ligase